jgi:predicted RNase H-like HicB family nuclease
MGTGRMRCTLHGFIEEQQMRGKSMVRKLTMMYWKGDRFWLGKLLEHPEVMTQGETLAELEENLKDAFRLMAMDDVPKDYKTKEIAL